MFSCSKQIDKNCNFCLISISIFFQYFCIKYKTPCTFLLQFEVVLLCHASLGEHKINQIVLLLCIFHTIFLDIDTNRNAPVQIQDVWLFSSPLGDGGSMPECAFTYRWMKNHLGIKLHCICACCDEQTERRPHLAASCLLHP